MGWKYTSTIRGVKYTTGKAFVPNGHIPCYPSCDSNTQVAALIGTCYYYGEFRESYSIHPYCITQRRPYWPDYFIDGSMFPALVTYVSYSANGGTGAPGRTQKVWGTVTTLSNVSPTRTGYTFLGWNMSSTATSPTYYPGSRWGGDSNITMYAVWKINTYTVSYNANGGSVGTTSQTYNYGSGLSAPTPTRTGYTFAGWFTAASGGSHVSNGTAITSARTLYAHWTIKSFTLTINPNGGMWNGSTSTQSKVGNYNTTIAVPNPTRTGYTFAGWTFSGGGKLSGTTYTVGLNNGNLVAQWTTNQYIVTYNASANGGSPSTAVGKNYNNTLGTLPTAERPYYKFLGWFTAASGGTKITSSYVVTNNVTFYAQFELEATLALATQGIFNPAMPYIKTSMGITYVYTNNKWQQGIGGL